jgi:hypothetical protein
MLSTTDRPGPALTGALALLIAVVLGAGVIAALTTGDDDGDDPAEEQAEREQAEREREPRPDPAAEQAAEADRRAFDIIVANFETCRDRYLPDARARHDQAVAQLREQEAALRRVIDALPPGRAKDSLNAQVGPDFESAIRVIEAELRGVETRCKLAFTVYQLTHDSLPRPLPPG